MKRLDYETWEELSEEEKQAYSEALMHDEEDRRWNEIEKEDE